MTNVRNSPIDSDNDGSDVQPAKKMKASQSSVADFFDKVPTKPAAATRKASGTRVPSGSKPKSTTTAKKTAAKKAVLSDDDEDDDLSVPPPPPKRSEAPRRAAAAKAKYIEILSSDEENGEKGSDFEDWD